MSNKKRVRKDAIEIENAVKEVLETGSSIRSVAKSYGIAKSMLARLVKANANEDARNFVYKPNIGNRKIFSVEEEIALVEYLKTTCKMSYGLTYSQTRQLAYDYAVKLGKKIPISWTENKTGGSDWLKGFMYRHKDLALRRPEKTSLARATAFNKHNVALFYNNLREILTRYKLNPTDIYNADETGLLTVTELPKVIGERGTKQIGQATSGERGQLVTMLAFISATGNTVPPVFVFPRVQFKDFMLQDAPPGSLGLVHKSGWMTSENFFKAFQHFVKHVKPTQDHKILVIMDNHESHISLDVVIHARENGVVLLTFPPHCSHRLQPLDLSVFGPFKNFFKVALNDWMVSNPGKTANIYHLPKFATAAYEKSFTIKNITSGFHKAGIFPFKSENFSEEDFLTACVSDRPLETDNEIPSIISSAAENPNETLPVNETTITTPELVRPFPKAPARKVNNNRGRKRGSSRILTDTPEKNQIAIEHQQKEEKKRKQDIKKHQLKRKV